MISPTAISTMLYCPRKLFLEKVLKLVKFPKDAMVKGTVKHEILELFNNKEKEIVTSLNRAEYDHIFNMYKKEASIIARRTILKHSKELRKFDIDEISFYSEFWNSLLSEIETKSKNVFSFMQSKGLFGLELWEHLTPKIISEYRISDEEIGLRGIIDQVMEYTNEIIPVEVKSGKSPNTGVWPGHKSQIAAYMLMLKKKGMSVKQGIVKYIDEKKEVSIPMNTLLIDQFKRQLMDTNQIIESAKIPKHIESKNKCSACQLKTECYDEEFIQNRMKTFKY